VNLALLLVLNLDNYLRKHGRPREIPLFCDAKDMADDFLRMINASQKDLNFLEYSAVDEIIQHSDKNVPIVVLTEDEPNLLEIRNKCLNPIIAPIVPDLGTFEFALFQELEAHDFELGGLNEWNGAPAQYSPYILQSLSRVHCRVTYPAYVNDHVMKQRSLAGEGRLRVLDIGCGPISRLRWGALTGELEIVGVDPLNDLYDAILARHGFHGLSEIRPERTINAFAESVDLGGEKFPLVYSWNAMDNTQDILKAMQTIAKALDTQGIALFTVNSKNGMRNEYSGLHKYDIWYENGILQYGTKEQPPRDLLEDTGELRLDRVYWANNDNLCVLLRL
jgi:SAM-dependent methyltransferase